jgi:energy-coupling factor transporter ATP-binding protein EcfA2
LFCSKESIDALAKAVNEFKGGLILVSHDMRLISQVADEIWICDNKTITKYQGDIQSFKMGIRAQMGILGEQKSRVVLRGDASVKKTDASSQPANKPVPKKAAPKLEVIAPSKLSKIQEAAPAKESENISEPNLPDLREEASPVFEMSAVAAALTEAAPTGAAEARKYVPLHLRKSGDEGSVATTAAESTTSSSVATEKPKYIPPHLRQKLSS